MAACPRGDKNGMILPVMSNLTSVVGIADLLRSNGIAPSDNFESIYSALAQDREHKGLLEEIELQIRLYFQYIRIPEHVTIYDKLLLSLREKDVIATFNWDPLLAQAYSRNLGIKRLPRILFLHGNVAIGVCHQCKAKGWRGNTCQTCGYPLEPVPLLYPVEEKDYECHGFIKSEWSELRSFLRTAYFLTFFGYGAPKADVAARDLLLTTWKGSLHWEIGEVEIVDVAHQRILERRWGEFFVRRHYLRGFRLSCG